MTKIPFRRQPGFHAALHPGANGGAALNILWDGKTSTLKWSGAAEDGTLSEQEQLMRGHILFLLQQDYLMTPTQQCGRLENLIFKPGDALRCLQPWSLSFTKGKLYPVHADGKIRFDNGTPVERSESFFAVIDAKDLPSVEQQTEMAKAKRRSTLDALILKAIAGGLTVLVFLALIKTFLASLG